MSHRRPKTAKPWLAKLEMQIAFLALTDPLAMQNLLKKEAERRELTPWALTAMIEAQRTERLTGSWKG